MPVPVEFAESWRWAITKAPTPFLLEDVVFYWSPAENAQTVASPGSLCVMPSGHARHEKYISEDGWQHHYRPALPCNPFKELLYVMLRMSADGVAREDIHTAFLEIDEYRALAIRV